ncbi:hypothetical protein XA68_10477 [Ophiocordyceps unilateralis]|uniref:rRNA methyltransferase 2, mitochondrial n=1 Tax=Ophiocordyceps unilateralis TaxID=268505 RepID=A0A2A9PI69_OPHUN|nr:hypothetical protein XA68_10477 [Ophiocordyceps unilateralis]
MRQRNDRQVREAKVKGLKSRAAFKLLELDSKYRLFKPNVTVVDLGYAPGSWSQVAIDRVRPHGQVIGIDLIPVQPPRGVASFQGNFLSPTVRRLFKEFIVNSRQQQVDNGAVSAASPSYIDRERHLDGPASASPEAVVDVVLSDMLMNASGIIFRDHVCSIDLCEAALEFASDTLRPGGSFVCKFYQGADDKPLELRLKKLFEKVFRDKPAASRSESNENYFIALRRKSGVFVDKIDSQ